MDMTEKHLSTERKYNGLIVNVDVDQALSPSGRTVKREVVHHPGGLGIVPIDPEGKVIMVRQYRYAMGKVVLEIPAGKKEPGEDFLLGAARELSEEIGAEGTLIPMGEALASPGISTEVIHLYLATDLTFGPTHPDPDEFLEIVHIPMDEVVDMIYRNEIIDQKTIAGIFKAKLFMDRMNKA